MASVTASLLDSGLAGNPHSARKRLSDQALQVLDKSFSRQQQDGHGGTKRRPKPRFAVFGSKPECNYRAAKHAAWASTQKGYDDEAPPASDPTRDVERLRCREHRRRRGRSCSCAACVTLA